MLVLLFIINNQFRFFTLEKNTLIISSILVDMALIYWLFNIPNVFFSLFFLLTAIDMILFFNLKWMIVLNSLLLLQMVVMDNWVSLMNLFINLIFFAICGWMAYQLKIQYEKKAEAQNFYDRLRIKEEELKQLNYQLEKYANTVESLTLLRERNRITREIHDHIGHQLSAAIIQLAAIEKIILKDGQQAVAMVSHLRQYQQETLQSIRELINELKPKEFERYEDLLMIEQMTKNFEKLTQVAVKVSILNEEKLTWSFNEKQSMTLYRVIQEFLANSLRHGKATQVEISFNFQVQHLVVLIQDNGSGKLEIKEGNGLNNMRRRLKEIGGNLNYKTAEDEGFFLVIKLPREGGVLDGN